MIGGVVDLIKSVQRLGFETIFNRYYSFYPGRVVDNNDPEKRGRVKIVVPELFGDDDKKALNWASPKDCRNISKDKGEFFPPDVDDWVNVEFRLGDPAYPFYSGGWYGKDEIPDEFIYGDEGPLQRGYKDKYGNGFYFDQTEGEEKVVFTTKAGHFIILDDTSGKEALFIKHKSGAQLQINDKGSINLFAKDGAYVSMNSDKSELTIAHSTGALIAMAKGGITISDSSGANLLVINNDTVQFTSGKDFVVQGNTATINSGSITLSDSISKLSIGNGKFALGNSIVEIVDAVIQVIDALLNDPAPLTTAVGPTSPFISTAKVQLTALKVLLTTVKGSV